MAMPLVRAGEPRFRRSRPAEGRRPWHYVAQGDWGARHGRRGTVEPVECGASAVRCPGPTPNLGHNPVTGTQDRCSQRRQSALVDQIQSAGKAAVRLLALALLGLELPQPLKPEHLCP
jgi:hypothetical protein